jgi:DNA-binding beta-propeller fold protein YncE
MPGYFQEAATGAQIRTFTGHSKGISSVAFSPDGSRVLSGSGDNTVRLWDAATGALIHAFEGHSNGVNSVAYSPDGSRLLSGSYDKTLKLWDAATGRLLRTFEGHTAQVDAVGFAPDGGRVVSGSWDKTLKLWDAGTGSLLRTFQGHSGGIWPVAFSPDGSRLVSGSLDDTLKVWETATAKLLRTIEHISGTYYGGVRAVAFSPDGSRVLSAGSDDTLKIWDTATGTLLRALSGHSGHIDSVAFSHNGRRIVSASSDSTVRLWDASTGELLVSLMGTRDGQWIAITPAGFFAASGKSAEQALSVVRGFDITTIGQVHQSLFNPDLVRAALAGDSDREVREAGKVINLEKVVDSGPAPFVEITRHDDASSTDLIPLEVRLTDKGKGVGRIEFRVNGITAAVAAKPSGGGPEYFLTQQLALDPGENNIEVVAYNANNLLASLPAQTTIKFTGPPEGTKPKLHILAIGINAYTDSGWKPDGQSETFAFPALSLAVKDATAFGEDMKRAASGLYEEVRLTTVLDKEATRANLNTVIGKLAADIRPRDTFILFAAAHGKSEAGRFYLIPQDYDGGPDPAALAARAIDQAMLQDWLANRIKAKKAIVLLDTCESGALVGGYLHSRLDQPASEAALGRLHEATGRPVLTAAAEGNPAFEGYEGHGVFTWSLLDALRHGDRNGNGTIELSELVAHVQDQVPTIATKLNGIGRAAIAVRGSTDGTQSARFGSRGEDFVIAERLK